MNDNFSNAMLCNYSDKNNMEYRGNEFHIVSYSWKSFPGFVAIDTIIDTTKQSIIIHHMYNADSEEYYSVTIGPWDGSIELTTDNFTMPLSSLLGITIGALVKSSSVIEFLRNFEVFTGYGFYKF